MPAKTTFWFSHLTLKTGFGLTILLILLIFKVIALSETTTNTTSNKVNYPHSIQLTDENNYPLYPISFYNVNNDLYFLTADQIYIATNVLSNIQSITTLKLKALLKPNQLYQYGKFKTHPQEFTQFCFKANDFYILDKSNSIFQYSIDQQILKLVRPNTWFNGEPDPQFIDISVSPYGITLLDPERNQVWIYQNGKIFPLLKQFFSWQLKPNCLNVTKALALEALNIINCHGDIQQLQYNTNKTIINKPLYYQHSHHNIPTRLVKDNKNNFFICYQENCKIDYLNTKTREVKVFNFPDNTIIRTVIPQANNFLVLADTRILILNYTESNTITKHYLNLPLPEFTMPVKGSSLPGHPGVYPGARRIYRHGIHKGIDFFLYGALSLKPANAYCAANGTIIRLDTNYKNMSALVRNNIIAKCSQNLFTSESNEDLLRGCQVWVSHSHNVITKYAHLNSINPNLKIGQQIKCGQIIGQIGSSGTSEGLSSHKLHQHLHFEIWVKQKYLGYGLTQAETIALYQHLFYGNKNYY